MIVCLGWFRFWMTIVRFHIALGKDGRVAMKEFDYDYPELEEAGFGSFVCGETFPGPAPDQDDETDGL